MSAETVTEETQRMGVPVFVPGMPLTDLEWAMAIRTAAAIYSLEPDQVLCTPYGYAPMPRPPEGNPDGTGRVWPGVENDIAIHPVFWLDRKVRRQRDGEEDDEYAIRIYLELVERGMIDLETQQPLNPFAVQGIDDTHPEVERDMRAYIDGENVRWLAEFSLPEPDDMEPDAPAELAPGLARSHREDYYALKQAMLERRDEIILEAVETLTAARWEDDSLTLRLSGDALLSAPRDKGAHAQIEQAVTTLLDRLVRLEDAVATVVRAVERADGNKVEPLDRLIERLERSDDQRRDQADRLLATVLDSPTAPTLGTLWTFLAREWDATVKPGQDAVSRLDVTRAEG